MLAGTPDTVVIVSSDDEEGEQKQVIVKLFIEQVGRPPLADEIDDTLRYMRWHPGVIDAIVDRAEAESLAKLKVEEDVTRLEAKLREVQQQRLKLSCAARKLNVELVKLKAAAAVSSARAKRIQATKRQIRVLQGRLANRDVKITMLQQRLLESGTVDQEVRDLGDELVRKNFLFKKWREYALSLEPYISGKSIVADNKAQGGVHEEEPEKPADGDRPSSADSGRGSAEPQAGPSTSRGREAAADPITVRAMLAAQAGAESDDEITVMAEMRKRARVVNHENHEILCRCSCGKRFVVKGKKKAESDKKPENK